MTLSRPGGQAMLASRRANAGSPMVRPSGATNPNKRLAAGIRELLAGDCGPVLVELAAWSKTSEMSYHEPVRRLIATALLALFSIALLSPLFASDFDTRVPACCRRDGKHRCYMRLARGTSESGPGLRANDRCRLYQQIFISQSRYPVAAIPQTSSLLISDRSRGIDPRFDPAAPSIALAGAHQQRGPPAFPFVS